MKAILNWVREMLGLDGHETEFHGLHPRQQEALAKATSTLERLFVGMEDIQSIGLDSPWSVRKYVQASWTIGDAGVTGESVRQSLGLDMPTQVTWLFGSTVRWETNSNVALVTVPSRTSGRVAVVMAVLPKMDEATGWLAWRDAVAMVVSIEDSADDAEQYLTDVRNARRTIAATLADLDRVRAEVNPGSRWESDDLPDF